MRRLGAGFFSPYTPSLLSVCWSFVRILVLLRHRSFSPFLSFFRHLFHRASDPLLSPFSALQLVLFSLHIRWTAELACKSSMRGDHRWNSLIEILWNFISALLAAAATNVRRCKSAIFLQSILDQTTICIIRLYIHNNKKFPFFW